ncbi:MAG: hypothetical protein GY758_08350, partial [Fuerstiella sp.]|nr:hypothetical protein [Fuerstiella sp.]
MRHVYEDAAADTPIPAESGVPDAAAMSVLPGELLAGLEKAGYEDSTLISFPYDWRRPITETGTT